MGGRGRGVVTSGVVWVIPFFPRDLLLGWKGIRVRRDDKKIWLAAPYCLFWVIWKERNKIVFENEDLSLQRLKNSFVYCFYSWAFFGFKVRFCFC